MSRDIHHPRGRVAVAMSGGVDSAVAAAWLVEQGYDVVGLTMTLWQEADMPANARSCCSSTDADDARRVAQTLGIAFYTVAMQEVFQDRVVTPFLQSYAMGRTPNPCILCNQEIKFNHLLAKASALEAPCLATGHYAQILKTPGGKPHLFCGADPRKDQSYFLASTPWTMLEKICFPLGAMTKEETRRLAQHFGLHLAQKQESQDVCFVPNGDYATFFRQQGLYDHPGPIRGLDGQLLGYHQGIHHYTIGQRRGLGISTPKPSFVVAIDTKNNTLIVGPEESLLGHGARLTQINWLIDLESLAPTLELQAKIRYASPPVAATLTLGASPEQGTLLFHTPQRAITPGQACVFYRGNQVLGGGWIDTSFQDGTLESC